MKGDARSVGELLRAADAAVRDALFDAGPEHAATHLAGWREVVEAAIALWRALPRNAGEPPLPPSVQVSGREMEAIGEIATRLRRLRPEIGWTESLAGDRLLPEAAAALRRATELVDAAGTWSPTSPAGEADLEASRTYVVSTVAHATHAARTSATQLHVARGSAPLQRTEADLINGLDTIETLALWRLGRTFPLALGGEHREPADEGRLGQACARWDLTAHRVLVNRPGVADLALVAGLETAAAHHLVRLIHVAADKQVLDAADVAQRLAPAVAAMASAWRALERQLRGFQGLRERADSELIAAGRELDAAFTELTTANGQMATSEQISQRVDLVHAVGTAQAPLRWSAELARAVRVAVAEEPSMRAPARLLAPIAARLDEQLAARTFDGQLVAITTAGGDKRVGPTFGGGHGWPLMQALPSGDGERLQWHGLYASDLVRVEVLDSQPRSCTERAGGPIVTPAASVEEARMAGAVSVADAVSNRDVGVPWQVRTLLMTSAGRVVEAAGRMSSAANMLTTGRAASPPNPCPTLTAPSRGQQTPPDAASNPTRPSLGR